MSSRSSVTLEKASSFVRGSPPVSVNGELDIFCDTTHKLLLNFPNQTATLFRSTYI